MVEKKAVENVLEQTLKNLRDIIDVDCIIGDAIDKGGVTLIPISKVSVGFLSGGGEYENKKNKKLFSYPFAGGSGGGCNINPIGFLVVKSDNNVEFIKINADNNIEKIIELVNKFSKSLK